MRSGIHKSNQKTRQARIIIEKRKRYKFHFSTLICASQRVQLKEDLHLEDVVDDDDVNDDDFALGVVGTLHSLAVFG